MNEYSEADYVQIDAFLSGRLSTADAQSFQQRLQNDPDLAAEVRAYWSLENAYRLMRRRDWLAELDKRLTEVEEPEVLVEGTRSVDAVQPLSEHNTVVTNNAAGSAPPAPSRVRTFWPGSWAMAAAVAGLLAGGYWLVTRQDPATRPTAETSSPNAPTQVDTTVREDPKIMPAPNLMAYLDEKPKQISVPAELRKAVNAYEQNQPSRARQLLRATSGSASQPAPTSDDEVLFGNGLNDSTTTSAPDTRRGTQRVMVYRQFYTGLSYLKQNKPDSALQYLKQVGDPLRSQAAWYRALALVQANQRAEAQGLLQRISRTRDHPYRADAQALLKLL